jgi:RND superfamily putative drug exporter
VTVETNASAPRSTFARLAGWSYRRRWLAVAAWAAVLILVSIAAQALGSAYRNDFSLPGTESQRALDTLQEQESEHANATVQVVVHQPAGLDAPATQQLVSDLLADLRELPSVVRVASPYEQPGTLAADGTTGYAVVTLDDTAQDVPAGDVRRLIEVAQQSAAGGLQVELGGDPVRSAEAEEGSPAELFGLVAALVILVVMFGSLLAASLPIIIAIFAVGSTLGLIALASHLATVADFTPPLMMLVGLGVGIDYALLVFARYRGELVAGAPRDRATITALDTAGRTVFLAGSTVIIALLGLVVLGLGSLQGVALAVALTVLLTMVASLTLLPALLALVSGRVERAVRRRERRRAGRDGAGWRRWTAGVQRRPWLAALLPAAALLALAVPALDMRLGFADAGNDPPPTTSRQAYDLLAEGFGPGVNGPLLVVVEDGAAAGRLPEALASTPGVAEAYPAGQPAGGGAATIVVVPETAPQDEETTRLVERLRQDVLPPLEAETGATFLVGGSTAAAVDFSGEVAQRLWWFVAAVVGLSALLLLVVFRSLIIPVKAAALNLLSVGASLGVITLVFQHGVLGGVLGVEPGPVEAFVPVMIFAIIFGLSMDYEIFLLSRMHERWQRGHDPSAAVREGLATTGRVVTAAAGIMIVVFGAFVLSPDRMLKQFGLGLAVAIFVDAVIIRCLILPALMQLLGGRAWWLPHRLGPVIPRIAVEQEAPTAAVGQSLAVTVPDPAGIVTGSRIPADGPHTEPPGRS